MSPGILGFHPLSVRIRLPRLCQPVFSSCPSLEVEHTPPPPARVVHQVTLSSCTRRLFDSLQSTISGSQEDFVPISVCSSIQCFLPLEFSASSKHCVSDCLRPCCHMLHSIVVSPLVRHFLSAWCPLSIFRWKLPCVFRLGVTFFVESLSSCKVDKHQRS